MSMLCETEENVIATQPEAGENVRDQIRWNK